jgi:predicted nucleic acid-binding protein
MGYLVDTNILLRMCQPNHPMYSIALGASETLLERGEVLYLTPQNIIEFWNVCTRPLDKNGLGKTPEQAEIEITKFERLLPMRPDVAEIYQQWRRLVINYQVKGVNVHDAKLVAACLVHGLTYVLTFNDKDFRRYTEISAIHPGTILKL